MSVGAGISTRVDDNPATRGIDMCQPTDDGVCCAYGLTTEMGAPGGDEVFPRFVLQALAAGYTPAHQPVTVSTGDNAGDERRPLTRAYFFFEKPSLSSTPEERPAAGTAIFSTPSLDRIAGDSPQPSEDMTSPPPPEKPTSGDSAAPEDLSQRPSPERAAAKEQKERVKLRGRVGRDPLLRTTRNNVLIARFPLAVPTEEGATAWHTIVAFNERATKVREIAVKGQVVEVIGYPHERVRKLENGQERTEREIYAAVVKNPREER